jgi:hypothetical protein
MLAILMNRATSITHPPFLVYIIVLSGYHTGSIITRNSLDELSYPVPVFHRVEIAEVDVPPTPLVIKHELIVLLIIHRSRLYLLYFEAIQILVCPLPCTHQ